ncbi:MAG: alpha/beta hydrolase [Cyclobacteriaceae bacterium]
MARISTVLIIFFISCGLCYSQNSDVVRIQEVYKEIDTVKLSMDVIHSAELDKSKKYPGIVFFFGGGWNGGSIKQFIPHGEYLAKKGMVCFLVDYRVKSRQGTTPFESLKDAKSAVRFIRKNAERFNLDPTRLVASGGSAGGHLAAATAMTTSHSEDTDDMSISCVPQALVLFNPVIDNGPAGYGHDRIQEAYPSFSPLHNIKKGVPPTIVFLGTNDRLIPVETMKYFQKSIERVGGRCDLHLYEGAGHGFFNYGRGQYYELTVAAMDQFLATLDYFQ